MSDRNILISVILPCYNAEKTISWTVQSVLKQTLLDFELICVDDASDDGTFSILTELARTDDRIVLLQNETNSGPGLSRNYGISLARADFIGFIDGDDFYEVDFLETLYNAITTNKADIVQCKVRYIYNDRNHPYGSPSGTIKGEHCKYRIDIDDGLPYLNPQVWNKLYRKKLFTQNGYLSICYEDAEILPHLLDKCEKFVCISDVLYNYNKRYSVLTGLQRKDPLRLQWYFDSVITSLAPYFDSKFQKMTDKWSSKQPTVTTANLRNLLNSIIEFKDQYDRSELKLIHDRFLEFSESIKTAAPDTLSAEYTDILKNFSKKMQFSGHADRGFIFGRPLVSQKISGLRRRILNIFERGMSTLDFAIPKQDKTWVFTSWARYEKHTMDNPRAVFESVKDDYSIRKIVILNSDCPSSEIENRNKSVSFYPLHSFRGLYAMLSAGRVFTAYSLHNIYGYRRLRDIKKRKIAQLWHGIPIKKVGLQVKSSLEPYWRSEAKRYQVLTASSQRDKEIMAESFAPLHEDRVKLTGLPRHDFLAATYSTLPADYQLFVNQIHMRVGSKKLVLFAPTWRYGYEAPCMFSPAQFEILDRLMRERNTVLGVRLHPNMLRKQNLNMLLSDHVISLNDIPDVNILLKETDVLITDYSSLYLDFMKLERPIILYTPDIDDYRNHRGFNYSSEEFVPHDEEIRDFDQLMARLESVLDGKHHLDDSFYKVFERFHAFKLDSANSKRLLHAIDSKAH
ncbi:MAG: CDP-glycerol glycerophosphotransferase family protein [Halioglobus sp.]